MCVQATEAASAEAQAEGTLPNDGIDQWLIDFAGLFREQLNIEPDRHLDLTGHAWDSLQAAMDAAVADERSLELFDQAWNKFQEVSASGGVTVMCRAAYSCMPSNETINQPLCSHAWATRSFVSTYRRLRIGPLA